MVDDGLPLLVRVHDVQRLEREPVRYLILVPRVHVAGRRFWITKIERDCHSSSVEADVRERVRLGKPDN